MEKSRDPPWASSGPSSPPPEPGATTGPGVGGGVAGVVDAWSSAPTALRTIETFVRKAKSSKKRGFNRLNPPDTALLDKMRLKDSLFDLGPPPQAGAIRVVPLPPPLPPPPPPPPPPSLTASPRRRERRNRRGGGGGRPEARPRIKKSKKRRWKKTGGVEREGGGKASPSDTDSEEEAEPPRALSGHHTHPPPASPQVVASEAEGREVGVGGKDGGGSTETSRDGDGSSSEGEMRVMDEDIMVESGDDSWDLITCYCQKPFAGRPMIECSQCGTWIHLSCARVRKNNVPDVFYCHKCREGPPPPRRAAPPQGPQGNPKTH
ncbi:PHD finger protein 23 [Neopsephotus bourkii]|uniref:PHD finger protein 23 n=1 Tax=Neopsephotus bourkii TaxID=309878 RepID=UPI002AA582A8|nr:PHD finger protein 23 [Neopsephotus bourkii]